MCLTLYATHTMYKIYLCNSIVNVFAILNRQHTEEGFETKQQHGDHFLLHAHMLQ